MDEIEFIIEACRESMQNSIVHLEKELLNIRAGKANPSMISSDLYLLYSCLYTLFHN